MSGHAITKYEQAVERGRRTHGEKYSDAWLDPRFVQYFNSGARIKVETAGQTITGTVGITTGWRPVFLLMRRRTSVGSSWTLGTVDRIVGVQRHGVRYEPVTASPQPQAKQSRAAAKRIEARSCDPRNGLVEHKEHTDEHGDLYQTLTFEDGTVEVWREWDDPKEMRLVSYTDKDGTREYWAEDAPESEGAP